MISPLVPQTARLSRSRAIGLRAVQCAFPVPGSLPISRIRIHNWKSWLFCGVESVESPVQHGSLNVPIEHHPTIGYMVYNGYYKVMSNIPKMGHLPIPAKCDDRVTRRKPLGGFRLLLRKQTWDDMGCTCTLSCRKRAKRVEPPNSQKFRS